MGRWSLDQHLGRGGGVIFNSFTVHESGGYLTVSYLYEDSSSRESGGEYIVLDVGGWDQVKLVGYGEWDRDLVVKFGVLPNTVYVNEFTEEGIRLVRHQFNSTAVLMTKVWDLPHAYRVEYDGVVGCGTVYQSRGEGLGEVYCWSRRRSDRYITSHTRLFKRIGKGRVINSSNNRDVKVYFINIIPMISLLGIRN